MGGGAQRQFSIFPDGKTSAERRLLPGGAHCVTLTFKTSASGGAASLVIGRSPHPASLDAGRVAVHLRPGGLSVTRREVCHDLALGER
jgi:hypothetical protein